MDPKERRPFRQALDGFSANASGAIARVKRRPVMVALGLLVAGAAVVAIVFAIRRLPLGVVAGGAPSGISELKQRTQQDPTSYERFRALGHAQFAAGRRAAALRSYGRALALDPTAVDETMLGNLALSFDLRERAAAEHVIARHHLVAMVPRLEQLAQSRSRDVRWAALATLEKLGRAGKLDYMHAYLADLEAPVCEVRQRAVEKLGDIGDHRVDTALRAAKKRDDDATPWYRSSCLGNRVDDAEKKIAARSPSPKSRKSFEHAAIAKK